MSIKDLERRLGVLEDIEEIKRLKARYCGSCDTSYDADGLSSLFAENGLMDDGWRGGGGGEPREGKRYAGSSSKPAQGSPSPATWS